MREAAGGGEGGGGTRDTESKTRTPHKDVGKKRPNLDVQISHFSSDNNCCLAVAKQCKTHIFL